jgi:hypothetical protein
MSPKKRKIWRGAKHYEEQIANHIKNIDDQHTFIERNR